MNILFFLTPKEEVTFIYEDDNIRQVLDKMCCHRYSCIPVLNKSGEYAGSITEGDLLWWLKESGRQSLKGIGEVPIADVPRRHYYQEVHIETEIEDLIEKAANQNYVPVVDDQDKFIGIITRKDIILDCYRKLKRQEAS